MAIISVSRQIASFGDELCELIARHLNYKFISRADIENKLFELGFSKTKLEKFDEKKPGFLSSLTNERDEYLDFLQLAILELVSDDNCVIIGRGSFTVLKEFSNNISLRFVADKKLRVSRYKSEHKCSEKFAAKIINESDSNREGFNKSFFNFDINNPALFHIVINTGLLDLEAISVSLELLVEKSVTNEKSLLANKLIKNRLVGQKIIVFLKYIKKIDIKFLRIEIKEKNIFIYGTSESDSYAQNAVKIVKEEFPEYNVCSRISLDD